MPPYPTSIAVCVYHTGFGAERVEGRLRASWTLTGDDAAHLAAGMNAAQSGGNPDPPASVCTQDGPVAPNAMLIVHARGVTTTVWVTFSSCTGRGLDNGVRQAHLTMSLVWEIMRGATGFTMRADLPD